MQAKNNKPSDDFYDSADMQELAGETPIGWSATCLDQTIYYYLDCDQEYSEDSDNSNPN
ncbi:hypothetical protein (chloroplast) [Porphyra umbilicalis]|uniref:Uncharacterized protein n=1 Tax=Porphyra umbilicalis TaxID=2786 RepID=J7F648_PORUM|nr:hypothetical protein [Porphyra umbilicalis]AFC39893.1 hypothetical protein [Porphyra umbilicalis]ASN78697.1 hypothetical protein [Porphyra umbilicalis]|eukprot:ASN78697.1 hypothetical protein (chloroplast) [Porphyra umbilicalis]